MNQLIFKLLYPYFLLSSVTVTFLDAINKLFHHLNSLRVPCCLTVLFWESFFSSLSKNMEKIYNKILITDNLNKWYSFHMSCYLTNEENAPKTNIVKSYTELPIVRNYDDNTCLKMLWGQYILLKMHLY